MTLTLISAGGLEAQSGLAAITDALKAYRPGATVLEAEVSKARGPLIGGTNAASTHSLGRMMVTKRAAHGQTISASKRRKVAAQVGPARQTLRCCRLNTSTAEAAPVYHNFLTHCVWPYFDSLFSPFSYNVALALLGP